MSALPDQPLLELLPEPSPEANPFALSQAFPHCWEDLKCSWCFVLVSKDGGQADAKH